VLCLCWCLGLHAASSLCCCRVRLYGCSGLAFGGFCEFLSLYVVVGFKGFLMLVKTYGYRRNRHMNEWNGPLSPRLTPCIIVLSFNLLKDLWLATSHTGGPNVFQLKSCCDVRAPRGVVKMASDCKMYSTQL